MSIAKKRAHKNFDSVVCASSAEWRHGLSSSLRRSRRLVRKSAARFEARLHWRSFEEEEFQNSVEEAKEAAKFEAEACLYSFYDYQEDLYEEDSRFEDLLFSEKERADPEALYDEYYEDSFCRYAYPEMFHRRSA